MTSNLIKVELDQSEIDVLAEKLAGIEATMTRCVALSKQINLPVEVSAEVGSYLGHARPADMNVYCGDDYSREGCSLAVHLTKTGWSFAAFAPGFNPGGKHGFIESYCGKHGSLGLVIDAYAAGKDIRSIRKQVLQAEADYAALSGVVVTL